MEPSTIIILCLFGIGIFLYLGLRMYRDWYVMQQAQSQAKDIIETAQEKADELMDYAKDAAADFARNVQEKNEEEFEKLETEIQRQKSKNGRLANELGHNLKDIEHQYFKSKQVVDNYSNLVDTKQAKLKKLKGQVEDKKKAYYQSLADHVELDLDEFVSEHSKKIISQTKAKVNELSETLEEELQEDAERNAKETINRVLNRFIRPYCPERGIGFIVLNDEKNVQRMLGPNKAHVEYIEQQCGVDIIYNERARSLSVSGFDPVRREMARSTLEFLVREKQIDESVINRALERAKRKLFKNIKIDGDKIAKELRLRDLSPEIRNMMGALRYRYSFTQNQYFHCAEVGHLCGLLAAEVGHHDKAQARRAGLLHDIGKAMDHSVDGGHAVIGADFIEKYGEKPEVVHAVRAHHYDEMPATDLAFLVIAADAISGARPGARRSTASTYMQKMDQLQEIGNSFEGVIDTFILSAGREVRITVDSDKISDHKALDLSKDIAKKIEKECNYPGTIKVTVVRQSQAMDLAR